MLTTDFSCLFSSVRNTSGGRKKFGFLPPHGRELANNEEFTVFGDIRQAIFRFERTEGRRNVIAFEAALNRGDLTIVHTPQPILLDTVTGATKMLKVTSGTLGTADPCWTTTYSDSLAGED